MIIGITGSNGFLGTYLKNELQKKSKIIEFEGDMTNVKDVENFMNKKMDIVYHLAGKIPKYDENGIIINQSFESNILGTQNLVNNAHNQNLKIIFASTQKVYGKHKKRITEMDYTNPIDEYEKSKLKSEQILEKKIPENKILILRFSNIYGDYPKHISIIESIAESIILKKKICIGLLEKTLRDYIHISDVINAFMLAKENFGIFNIGYGKALSVNNLMELFQKITKQNPQIEFGKSSSFDITLDCEKAKRILKFEPKITVEVGIKNALDAVIKHNKI